MKNITYREIDAESLQLLRPLCDALMKLQASRASKYREILASMNFDNRLAPSFESAGEKFCLAAFDSSQPVGYVFASTETVTEKSCAVRRGWAASFPPDSHWLYPDGLKLPCRIGELVNLYVLPQYRGMHIGQHFMTAAMQWLHSRRDLKRLLVYVSNGNNPGPLYEKYGFHRSFEVLDGMITAYEQNP